jgi:hypothetical protein
VIGEGEGGRKALISEARAILIEKPNYEEEEAKFI